MDPLTSSYPHNSPYAFSENRVVDGVELEGLEVLSVGKVDTYSIGGSYSIERGIVFAPEGAYLYKTTAWGLESNISLSRQLSITYFPDMPSVLDFEGEGRMDGFGGGSLVASVAYSKAESNGYEGHNIAIGPSLSVSPISVNTYDTKTIITKSLTKSSRNNYDLAELNLGLSALEKIAVDIRTDKNELIMESFSILNENNILLDGARVARENNLNAEVLLDAADKNIEKYNKIKEQINDFELKLKDVEGFINEYKEAIESKE